MSRTSVVIPTRDRAAQLGLLLDDLSEQSMAYGDFEVIVVDDGSRDDTVALARRVRSYRLRVLTQVGQGAASARNRAACEADGELLVFLDDDMRVDTGYLAALRAIHNSYNGAVGMCACRRVSPAPGGRFGRLFGSCAYARGQGIGITEVAYTECESNNMSVMKEAFGLVGGFRNAAGDGPATWGDVEFGFRARASGLRFYRSSISVCEHVDYSLRDLRAACERSRRVGRQAHALLAACPEIEDDLPMLLDKLPIDWRADPVSLSFRKLLRRLSGSRVGLAGLRGAAAVSESSFVPEVWARAAYRWLIGAELYRGFASSGQR